MTETVWPTCLKYLVSSPFQNSLPTSALYAVPIIYFQCGQGPGQPSGCWSAAKDHWARGPVGAAGGDAQRNVGKGMEEISSTSKET